MRCFFFFKLNQNSGFQHEGIMGIASCFQATDSSLRVLMGKCFGNPSAFIFI